MGINGWKECTSCGTTGADENTSLCHRCERLKQLEEFVTAIGNIETEYVTAATSPKKCMERVSKEWHKVRNKGCPAHEGNPSPLCDSCR